MTSRRHSHPPLSPSVIQLSAGSNRRLLARSFLPTEARVSRCVQTSGSHQSPNTSLLESERTRSVRFIDRVLGAFSRLSASSHYRCSSTPALERFLYRTSLARARVINASIACASGPGPSWKCSARLSSPGRTLTDDSN